MGDGQHFTDDPRVAHVVIYRDASTTLILGRSISLLDPLEFAIGQEIGRPHLLPLFGREIFLRITSPLSSVPSLTENFYVIMD